jgi:hypothetical protein
LQSFFLSSKILSFPAIKIGAAIMSVELRALTLKAVKQNSHTWKTLGRLMERRRQKQKFEVSFGLVSLVGAIVDQLDC